MLDTHLHHERSDGDLYYLLFRRVLQHQLLLMYRNDKLLRAVRDAPCMTCGIQDGTVVAAHSNQLRDGKGRSIKANDYRIAALCFRCHMELDQGSKMSKQERFDSWEAAHRATIGWLFDNDLLRCV